MAMSNKGLTKLIEEAGEVIQIAAKKCAFMNTDEHPDGKGSMKARLEDEIADFIAAACLVSDNLTLDKARVNTRVQEKLALFREWDALP